MADPAHPGHRYCPPATEEEVIAIDGKRAWRNVAFLGQMLYDSPVIGDIRKHLANPRFIPFRIRMADGREYPVPTIDHLWLLPSGSRVLVSDDNGFVATLPGLLISGIVQVEEPETAPNA